LFFCDHLGTQLKQYVLSLPLSLSPSFLSFLSGDEGLCVNPKINNLIKGYNMAKYNYVLISDSNVLMRPDTLSKMVALLEMPNVGLVHQVRHT
jgi:hypothetical protein